MEVLLEGSLKQIQALAQAKLLTWRGKKIVLDPFLNLTVVVEVQKENDDFLLTPWILVGKRKEEIDHWDLIAPWGALEGNIFRLWEDKSVFRLLSKCAALKYQISGKQLEELTNEGFEFHFIEPKGKLKPDPLPILQLVDKTGAFANLCFDYGPWGEKNGFQQTLSEEEKYLENDLLETGFQKKQVSNSSYFCPLDQVGKSLSFLLELGWKITDYTGKNVILQTQAVCEVEEQEGQLTLQGHLVFKDYQVNIAEVKGAFETASRWVNLSPSEVGLLDLSPAFDVIKEGVRKEGKLLFKRSDVGLLTDIAKMPMHYQKAAWEEHAPSQEFCGRLFEYQQKGVSWLYFLYKAGFSGLLADEMGLGKTVQTLGFLSLITGPVLIVMPVTLLSLWKNQIHQFLPNRSVYVHQGPKRARTVSELASDSIILTSYATLRQDAHLFWQNAFEVIILDEAQTIKNQQTKITEAVYGLHGQYKLALTGTPIENRLDDAIAIFTFLLPEQTFLTSAVELTYKKMRPFILRRTKEQVAIDLPEKIEQIIEVDPFEEEFLSYEKLLQSRKSQILKGDVSPRSLEVLELILRLRQHVCDPSIVYPDFQEKGAKLTRVLNDLEEAAASLHKVLLYSQFTSILKKIADELTLKKIKFVYLDGSTKDRESVVRQFQEDPATLIFLISLKAGGVGLNLQAAHYVFMYDPWWNSALEAQAISRAHRIGQKNSVIVRKYIVNHSIEAKIVSLQQKKQSIAEALWDAESPALDTISFEEIKALLDF